MQFNMKRNITALLLTAAIIFPGFFGTCSQAYASQQQAKSSFHFPEAEAAFDSLLSDYDLYGVSANSDTIPIYQEASQDAAVVQTLASGRQIQLTGVVWDGKELWFQVRFAVNDAVYHGYIQSRFTATEDSRLAEWEARYLPDYAAGPFYRGAAKDAPTESAFPDSYRPLIQKLAKAHPNWTFVPMNTGLNWNDVVEAELVDSRNLVELNCPDSWKSKSPKDYNAQTGKWIIKSGSNWVQASKSIIMYYLDPRNFLTEESVFQFEQLVYGSHHTKAGVEQILNGTFMSKKKLEDGSAGGITYAQAFMKIGKSLKISPYFLASRVRQEQGVNGDSPLISGTYPGFKGYYNYFNRRASGVGEEVIKNGLQEAKSNGWNTRYKSLKGGAKSVASDFIFKGQDTFYLQKFDVDDSYDGLYWHQYMQNLLAADNEGKSVQKSYKEMGILNNSFVFKVPVYNNMPASPCPIPTESLSKPSLKVKKNGYLSVKLSWNGAADAEGYQIYRLEGTDGAYKKIATTKEPALSFEDSSIIPGKQYRYKVRAYQKSNGQNQYSAYSDIKAADFTIPSTAWGNLKAKNYKTIELSWKKKSVDGYKIYRKTDNGAFRLLQTLRGRASSSFKDTSVKPGHTYSYRICGYISVKGLDYRSAYTPAKKTGLNMAQPKLKKASALSKKKIKLAWQRDSKADGYFIYRASSKKGTYKKIKTITKNKTTSWSDTNIKTGKTYYYKIRSYVTTSNGTKSSEYSAIKSAKTKKK